MRRIKNSRSSPAIVVAVLALVAALAGTAIAAPGASTSKVTKKKVNKLIDKRFPVGTSGISDNAVTTPKIADSAVTAPKIADSAVGTGKLADGAVASTKLGDAAVVAAKLGTVTERDAQVAIADGTGGSVQVDCLAGERVISGGVSTLGVGTAAGWSTIRNGPTATGWDAAARNETGSSGTLIVEVLCLGV
jgi:hypothetical protein